MTNQTLLRRKIDESGYKLRFVASQAGLTYQGFLYKVKGVHDFTAPEICKISELLKLTLEEKEQIFFADNVSK